MGHGTAVVWLRADETKKGSAWQWCDGHPPWEHPPTAWQGSTWPHLCACPCCHQRMTQPAAMHPAATSPNPRGTDRVGPAGSPASALREPLPCTSLSGRALTQALMPNHRQEHEHLRAIPAGCRSPAPQGRCSSLSFRTPAHEYNISENNHHHSNNHSTKNSIYNKLQVRSTHQANTQHHREQDGVNISRVPSQIPPAWDTDV